jgi:hypothetical protein
MTFSIGSTTRPDSFVAKHSLQPTSVFAWDVSAVWSGNSAINPASPSQGQLDGQSNPPSGGNRYHSAEDSYTWWSSTARTWILNNQSNGTYKESLVFHTFKPNTNDACGLGVETNSTWAWSSLPALSVYVKATCLLGSPISEIRLRIGNPSALCTGSGCTYYAQTQFKDWSPYENGEVSNDSYWENTATGQGLNKNYLTKFCYYTSGVAVLPVGGRCP